MPSRTRFLTSSPITRKELRVISEALSRVEYSDEVAWGFLDIRNEGDAVTGTFVERFETEEQIANPFGQTTVYKRIQYNQTVFRLGLTPPQLEIYDGPRSITPLITELSKSLPQQIAFSPIDIDLQKLIKNLKQSTSSLTLVAAHIKDIGLAADVFARVSVIGSGEVTPYLKVVSLGKKLILDKIHLKGSGPNGGFKIEITSDGRITIHSGDFEFLNQTLRKVVVASLEQ